MFQLSSPREVPATEAARLRNVIRTLTARITERVKNGGYPTKDQTADFQRAMRLLESANV